MADRSGEQFGDYRLIRKLGEGSFGAVYEAEHRYLQTRVAIKVLRESISQAGRQALRDYALGSVVYEWLTGSRPFQGTPLAIVTQKQLKPVPPVRDKVPSIPPAVEQVVLQALAKDPKDRHASVQAFATALEEASVTKRPVEISHVSALLALQGAPPTVPTARVLAPPQAMRPWVTRLLVSLAVLMVINGSLLGWRLVG